MWWQNLFPDTFERVLMYIGAACGGFMSFAFGEVNGLLEWLMVFAVADYATGTFGALRTGTWRSSTCGIGIAKKVCYFAIVALAHGLDASFEPIVKMQIVQNAVICAYLAGEFGSIIENLDRCGIGDAVPLVIRKMIAALNTRIDSIADDVSGRDKQEH